MNDTPIHHEDDLSHLIAISREQYGYPHCKCPGCMAAIARARRKDETGAEVWADIISDPAAAAIAESLPYAEDFIAATKRVAARPPEEPRGDNVTALRGRKPSSSREPKPPQTCEHGIPLGQDCAACHGIGDDDAGGEPPAA
jgi:hypothetical protein